MKSVIRRILRQVAGGGRFFLPGSHVCRKESVARQKLRGWLRSGKRNVCIGRGCVVSASAQIGEGTTIEDYARITGSVRMGQNVYVNCFTMISGEVEIGDGVLISQFVTIWARAHRFMDRDLPIWDLHGEHGVADNGYDTQPIRIGAGAWIGPQATIFRGVSIGEGAVIGAGSVVTHDVPAYAVCWGVPAQVVKYRQSTRHLDASTPKGDDP